MTPCSMLKIHSLLEQGTGAPPLHPYLKADSAMTLTGETESSPFVEAAPAETPEHYEADVAIVGYGPVGALLALLLAQRGHRVVALDRWLEPYALPRAVTFDHEIARILSMLGIDSDDDPTIERHPETYYWKNADLETLLEVDWGSTAASGWATRYWFYQPELEARFREMAQRHPEVTLLRGFLADELTQDEESAVVSGAITDGHGRVRPARVSARYVVGADGANSFVRTSLDLPVDDRGYFFDWLILDMHPTEQREWSPAHWQLCDPKRPTTIVPGGPGRRRWEFMVLPGESPAELATPESAWKLLEPWDVTPENAILERSAVYRFQAMCAQEWRRGRGLIAGDAAHLMPPFAGEGMCAGVRDSVALAWRLDLVLRGVADDALLDSYGPERAYHVEHYIDFSMELGQIICVADPEQAAARDERMKADLANHTEPRNTDIGVLGPGAWAQGDLHAGELAVQGRVTADGRTDRFDDVVCRGWILLGLGENPWELLDEEDRRALTRLGARSVSLGADDEDVDVVDTDGVFGAWLADIDARYVLIRPDFYVAATATDAEHLRRSVRTVLDALHLSPADQEHTR